MSTNIVTTPKPELAVAHASRQCRVCFGGAYSVMAAFGSRCLVLAKGITRTQTNTWIGREVSRE